MRDGQDELKRRKTRSRVRTWVIGIFLILIFLVAGGLWYWNANKKQIIGNKLEKSVREGSDSLYTFKYDSIDLQESNGYFSISNMRLFADSIDLERTTREKGKPAVLVDAQIPRLIITGLKTPKAFFNNKLIARKLEIVNPVIEIRYGEKKSRSDQQMPKDDLRKIILGKLSLIDIDTVLVTGGKLVTRSNIPGKKSITVEDFGARFYDLHVDSVAANDSGDVLFSRKFELTARKTSWTSPKKFYRISLDNFSLNSATQTVAVGKFSLIPAVSESEFARAHNVQLDRIDFWSTMIEFTGVRIDRLFRNELVADHMKISQASCNIYRDITVPRGTEKKTFYLQSKDGEVSFIFDVNKATIQNSVVEYKERNDLTGQLWSMSFNDASIHVNNLKNRAQPSEKMTAVINARFLNKVPVTMNWIFFLNDNAGRFDVKARAGELNDAVYLNKIIEPTSMAKIREGSLQSLSCDLSGNSNSVGGTVNLLYKDLKIDVLEKDPGASKTDRKFLTSLFLNVKTKDENPKGNNPPRVATVNISRDQQKSIFNACWKAIFKGISDITGIPASG